MSRVTTRSDWNDRYAVALHEFNQEVRNVNINADDALYHSVEVVEEIEKDTNEALRTGLNKIKRMTRLVEAIKKKGE